VKNVSHAFGNIYETTMDKSFLFNAWKKKVGQKVWPGIDRKGYFQEIPI
jgi:hypothetical protein